MGLDCSAFIQNDGLLGLIKWGALVTLGGILTWRFFPPLREARRNKCLEGAIFYAETPPSVSSKKPILDLISGTEPKEESPAGTIEREISRARVRLNWPRDNFDCFGKVYSFEKDYLELPLRHDHLRGEEYLGEMKELCRKLIEEPGNTSFTQVDYVIFKDKARQPLMLIDMDLAKTSKSRGTTMYIYPHLYREAQRKDFVSSVLWTVGALIPFVCIVDMYIPSKIVYSVTMSNTDEDWNPFYY